MSWDGTVRCSSCYGKGHNKSGCPDRKARYERIKKEQPDSWYVREYEAEEKRRKRRSCGYCKEEGHTKRTCMHLKEDKAKTVQMNKEWRREALNLLVSRGIGIGALVQLVHKSSWQDDQVKHVMISDILWENLTFKIQSGSNPYAFQARVLDDFSQYHKVDFPQDPAGVVTQDSDYGLHAHVIGPVPGSSIEATVPEGWLSGDGPAVQDMFLDSSGKTCSRHYIDWVQE